jgi:hypothetical protein
MPGFIGDLYFGMQSVFLQQLLDTDGSNLNAMWKASPIMGTDSNDHL